MSTLCLGQAASTSAILVAVGAPGKRSLLPHARVVLQQPHTEGSRGSLSDLALEAAELARIRAQAEGLLAGHTGRSVDQIRIDTNQTLVLPGEHAVAYGIADQVIDRADSGDHQQRAVEPPRPGA